MTACANCDGYASDLSHALSQAVRLRARLVEVEAERDRWKSMRATEAEVENTRLLLRAEAAEARLAAAIGRLEMFKRVGSMDPVTVDGLTATLRGESDRPAEGRR